MKKIAIPLLLLLATPAWAQWDTGGAGGDTIADMTAISDTTWGAGEADHVWTFDTTGTNPVLTTSSGSAAWSNPVVAKQLQSGAAVGSELTTNGTFTTDLTGWSGDDWSSSSDTALHAADTGHTAALTQNITVTTGETYQINFTIAGRTAGSVAVTIGSATVYLAGTLTAFDSNNTFRRSFVAADTGAVALNFTPTATFDGSIDTVTVKAVTLDSNGVGYNLLDSAGNANLTIRASLESENNTFLGRSAGVSNSNGIDNTFVGRAAGYNNVSGHSNVMVGKHAGISNTLGYSNTFLGVNAGYTNTTGTNNTLLGQGAGYAITTAVYDTVVGQSAGLSLTSGDGNTLVGQAAGQSLTTASYNVVLGWGSGRYLNNGSTVLETPTYSTYIGYRARASATDETNAVVIGGNTPLGKGSNTTVIGTSGTTKNYIYGTHNDPVQSVTCDPGAGVHAETITPTSSYIEITNSDAEGCDITMSETGAVIGDVVTMCVISNAGATVNFADTAGVSETAGAFAAAVEDCITMRYGTTTWREVSRSNN